MTGDLNHFPFDWGCWEKNKAPSLPLFDVCVCGGSSEDHREREPPALMTRCPGHIYPTGNPRASVTVGAW